MYPVAFHLGGLTIYWYGVLVAAGFLAGIWTASRRAPLDGISSECIVDLAPWLVVGAIVGSRLLYVISYWQEDFAGEPWWKVFMIRQGGLVFYGGLVGAALACMLFVRRKGLSLWKIADALAPSVALGHVFGRAGCLMNGCCYGKPCDLPWAVRFPNGHETHPHAIHPSQVYESLANLAFFLLLAWFYRRKRYDGQVLGLYLTGYAVMRFSLEFFRGDYVVRYLGGWATPGQLFSFCVLAAGLALLWWQSPRRRPLPPRPRP